MSASTVPTVKAALVSLLTTALQGQAADGGDLPVFWCWQPDVQSDCCFLGRAITDSLTHDLIEITYDPLTAELNWPATETYTVPVSLWSWRGDLNPEGAQEAEELLYQWLALVLAALADVDLGVARLNARPSSIPVERRENGGGWVVWAIADVSVTATIT